MRSGRLLNLFVLIFLALSMAPGGVMAMQVDPQADTPPPAGRERPGPQPGIEQIDGSTVNSVTPAVLVPGTAVDLCFNVTVFSPDKEYMDRFDFNLPDTWTVNSVGDVAGTGCGRGHTFGVEAGNVVYWQTNGYPPQTGCGDWANGAYDFCANVTVPDCSGAPWSLPWNVTGDGYGNPPHGASGTATAACTVQITPPSLAQVLCPDETATQDVTICNYGVAPLTWSLVEVPGLAALGQPSPRSGAGLIEAGSLWDTGVLVRTFADHSGSTPVAAENNGAYLLTVSGGSATGNRFARYLPDGTFDAGFASGIDFRSIDTANNQDLYAKGYPSGFYSITAGGVATYLFDLPGADAQSSAVFSADDTELYALSAGTVRRHSAATGAYLGQFTLNGVSGGELAYPANVQIDTDRSGRLVTYADGVVSEWDLAGNRIGTCTIPIATPSDFDTTFSFAVDGDGLVYLLNAATYNWQVYDIGLAAADIPWLSEDLTGGTIPPGECSTITVTFDSTGLAPGDYAGALEITTDDPQTPYVTIPVSLTVLAPADITGVTYTPTNLQVAFDATAAGAPPLSYLWDFGDGATSDLEDPTHTYAAGGCYTATLAVSNGCGEDTWSEQVCVCDPVSGVDFSWSPLAPLYGETAYFTATVAAGTPPFTYDWDWGDGTAHGSGQYASHAYALPGQYTVTLMVANACGQAMMQHTITVTGPDIQVTPTSLSQTLCPDQTAAQQLQICNLGDGPLTWSLTEIPATVALGAAPIPPLRDAPARSDEGAAFPRMAAEKRILANPVLIVQDDLPWYRWSTPNILSANGIGYDQVGSAQMATVDLTPYVLVIVASAQSDAFYTAWNASFARFEAYVAGGGALWIGTATSTAGLTNPLLPGGVVLNDDIYAQYGNVAAPGHPWVAGVSSPFEGLWVSHGEFSNLYPGSIVVATSATTGNPTLVDYAYGAGRVLVTSLTLEIGWDYGWSEAPILQNSLLDMYVPLTDIPWLSEDLTGGTVPPGECQTVTVTFDSAGLAPGDYYGDLLIESNDPDEPQVTVPVSLTVLVPADIVSVTYTATDLQVAFDATAVGEPPLSYAWDFGDGGTSNLEDPTHTYAAGGCYTVTLVLSGGCGEDIWTGQVCVCDPANSAEVTWSPAVPLINETVAFTATVLGTPPFSYTWDFGDGVTGNGQTATHAYAASGTYTVTLTVDNGCGTTTVQHTVTVSGIPDIQVTPSGLSAALCPDSTATRELSICNVGTASLDWTMEEISGTGTLGLAPIPARRAAPARSDQGAAFAKVAPDNHILANQVLIIEDQLPWYEWSTHNILTANGIPYDQIGSAQMATIDLTPYVLVIISSDQPDAFYTTWNANLARFEAYVAGGGALWIGTATASQGLTDPLLPGGVVLNDDIFAQYGNVAAPGHPWVVGVSSPFDGHWASHGEFSNLYPGSIVVATSATTGNPTLVDYQLGSGRVLITALTLEIGWDYGWGEAPILQNSLLDMYHPTVDVPWLSETPISGTLAAGGCATVTVTFDSTGMAPGDYYADLQIDSNDPDEPLVTIPVTLTVLAAADITNVTYTATSLQVAFDATAVGEPPLTYAWSFGDGGTSNLEDPTHTYAAGGCYQVSLVVSNGCGQDFWSDAVCVCDPVSGVDYDWSPLAPLVNETVSFTATVAGGTPPFTYDWDWGDGTAHGSGQYAGHAYAAAGTYNVILTVTNGCGQAVMQHAVVVIAPNIEVTPTSLAQELCPDATATQPLTICNTGTAPLTWSLSELSGTVKYAGKDVVVHVPAIEAGPKATSRSGSQAFPARDLTVHVGWVSVVPVDVLIVTPDVAGGGDISLLLNTLAAFPDLIVTVWDGSVGTPTVADMQGYDVVFVGNDILWTSSAIDKLVLSDRLADYIDAGGKVLAASFIWSYDDWGMAGGRFLTQDYSPFEMATTDYWDPISLGAFDAGHPIMAGITNVTENYNHQDPALSSNGVWVASWIDSLNFVGVAPNSAGLNALYFHNANFGGQAGEVLHNALLYLAAATEEIPWLSEDPISGTVPPGECTVVEVTFDSTGMAPGDYLGSLVIASDDPDTPEVAIPVTLTVLEPATIAGVTYTITGVEVAFDATVTGAAPLTYAWTFGDGGTAAVEDPTHTYAATGCYTPTLTVTNGCGQDTWSERICVCEAVAGADFYWVPASPVVGEMTDLIGSIAAGSPPLVWHWDFDDGTTAGGQSVLHAFATPGDHLVTLTVTNGCGQTVVEHTVTVLSSFHYYYVPIVFTGHGTPWPPPDRR